MALVSRDPFARQEIHREPVSGYGGCKECGQLNGFKGLFQYRSESDGGRKSDIPGKFCSVGCMKSYHGL